MRATFVTKRKVVSPCYAHLFLEAPYLLAEVCVPSTLSDSILFPSRPDDDVRRLLRMVGVS